MNYLMKSGPYALLLSSVCATSLVAQPGFVTSRGGGITYDEPITIQLLESGDITFQPNLTADNGLTFGAGIELVDENDPSQSPEAYEYIRGSFGEVRLGSEPRVRNQRVSDGPWGACGSPGRVSLDSIALSTQYVADLDRRERGSLAYDQGGIFINPGTTFEYKLNGAEFGIGAEFCLDYGNILPTKFSVGFDWGGYEGFDEIFNQNFPNLGVTGVGTIPGVLINSPTDIQNGYLQADRHGYGLSFDFSQPIWLNARGANATQSALSGPFSRQPSVSVISVVGGLRYGMEEQTEQSQIFANTPAFGAASQWDVSTYTQFDTDRIDVFVGLQTSKSIVSPNGGTNTYSLTGTVGYGRFDVNVHDQVRASGLGAALNYNEAAQYDFTEYQLNASLTAAYDWKKGNEHFSLWAGLDFGSNPEYNYLRLDSNAAGTPLSPSFGLSGKTQATLGLSYAYNF